jgi:hypothetical protein
VVQCGYRSLERTVYHGFDTRLGQTKDKLQMWETKICGIVYLHNYVNVHSFLLRSSYHSFSGVSVAQSLVSVNFSVDQNQSFETLIID